MQYLLVSDLHYVLPQLDWIAEQAHDFDAVVFAGDQLDVSRKAELPAQIALWSAYLADLTATTTVIVCSGNHDLDARRADEEKAATWIQHLDPRIVVDGQRVRVGDDLVSACAWWEGPATKAEVEAQLAADATVERPGRWIWAYHSPPDASPTAWGGRRHFGDEVLNALIERHAPDVVCTGHVHDAPFRPEGGWVDRIGDTIVFNAGRQTGPVPAHLVIDTGAGTAEWWSMEGRGTVELPPLRTP